MELTNARLEALLSEGRGVFLAGDGPLFLAPDGALYDNGGAMLLPPEPERSAIAARYRGISVYTLPAAGSALGGVKNGGTVTAAPDGTMTVPGIVPLRAVSAEAPASPQAGEKYGNTTDGKIYKAASGSWAEAAGDDAAAAGILYAAGGRFWRWDAENGFALI